MKYLVMNFIHGNRTRWNAELMFGKDWNQNTKEKR